MGVKKEFWTNSPFFAVFSVLARGFLGPKIVKVLFIFSKRSPFEGWEDVIFFIMAPP